MGGLLEAELHGDRDQLTHDVIGTAVGRVAWVPSNLSAEPWQQLGRTCGASRVRRGVLRAVEWTEVYVRDRRRGVRGASEDKARRTRAYVERETRS